MHRSLVIGATGLVGRQVAAQLIGTGIKVRAVTRNPTTANLPSEVEVIGGDFTLAATLDECLDGVDSVFLVWTAPPAAVASAIEQIAKHARRIVFLSSPYQTAHPLFQAPQPNPMSLLHAEIERTIKASGLAWTFLRPGMFAANAALWWAPQIRAGNTVRWPYALAPTAPIHERDIAAVAVHSLSDSKHAGAEYVITSSQSLIQRDQVSIIGEVLGRPLRFEEITPEEWLGELPGYVPTPIGKMLLRAWSAAVGQPALVTSTVAEVTGRQPSTFRDWVIENAAEFQ